MNSLSIAVVIPAYNAEAYICEALDSVAAQSRLPEQIIVIDDGSIDRTADCIRCWKQESIPLHLLQQPNRGVSAARNAGIRYANTDLIATLDADDQFLPHHLEQLERAFKRHPENVLCFADVETFSVKEIMDPSFLAGKPIETLEYNEQVDGLRLLQGSVYSSLVGGNYIHLSSCLFSKKAIESVGLFDETLQNAEDRDFLLRLSRVSDFSYYPFIGARKRIHPYSLTHTLPLLVQQRSQFSVLLKMLDRAGELDLSEEERRHTRAVITQHIDSMLYTALRKGPTAYFKTNAYFIRRGVISPAYAFKHFWGALLSQSTR